MNRGDYEERSARNEASRNQAQHHAEPWSSEEVGFLREQWDGTEETLAAIAELLGRTIEACRQMFYTKQRGHIHVRTVTVVTGWLVGYCFECGRFADVYSNGVISLCEDCR